jgi:hypothetical protein
MVTEFPPLCNTREARACHISDHYLLGEGVDGTNNEGSDGFRFGDDDGVAMAKDSPGISLSCACKVAICFLRASCLRCSSSNLLLEDSMYERGV